MANETIKQSDLDNFINTTLYIDGVVAQVGDVYGGKTLTVVVDDGYILTNDSLYSVLQYTGYNAFGDLVTQTINIQWTYNANMLGGSFVANYSGVYGDDKTYIGLYCAVEETGTPTVEGDNSIYYINQSILTDVNNSRFVANGSEDSLDYGVYILSVLSFPFELPESVIDVKQNIYLANINTGVEADSLKVSSFTVDLGEITVNGSEQNLLDYVGVTALLHLPFSEPVEIDLNYLIDETIKIEYVVSAYDSNVLINIKSSKLNYEVVESVNVVIGNEIPYITTASMLEVKNNNIKLGVDNGVYTPYIELIKNDVMLKDGFFTIPILDENVLTGETGLVRIEEINLVSNALKNEKEELINILQQGIIINE